MQSFWAFWEANRTGILIGIVGTLIGGIFTVIVLALLRDLIKHVAQRLWGWLVASLHGQGARFRGRYLKAMAERHGRLRLIGIYNQGDLHPPRLREVFISLRVAAGQGDGPKMGWGEALGPDRKRVVILGAPGAGKTTLLDYLVLVLAGEVKHPLRAALGNPIPLVARLRELGTPGKDDLMSLLRGSVPLTDIPDGYPKRWLRKGGCALLLDGLDEVLDEVRHERVVEEIKRLALEFPDNLFVVTCRLAGWHSQLSDVGFQTFEVQVLDADDIRQFLAVWYREVLRAKDVNLLGPRPQKGQIQAAEERARIAAGQNAENLWTALSKNENLLRIARTPLLLSLVTLVHYYRVADLPKGRAELYSDCLRILLELWDKSRQVLQVAGPTLKEKLMVLRAIAFHYLENDLLEADLPTLERLVAPLLPKINVAIEAEALVRQIEERSGVLVELAIGRYGFAHRALHDALAADWIVEHDRDELLCTFAGQERWREVILIAAGRVPEARAHELMKALLASDAAGAGECAALQIAGLALAEDIPLGDDLRGQVRQRLIERLSREEAAGTFGRLAGSLLAGDPEVARDWMKETLGGEKDPQRRKRLLDLLPALGEVHVRPLLPLVGRIVGDSTAGGEARVDAALALAQVGIAPASEVWDALDEARTHGDERLKAATTWAWCELGRASDLGLVQVPAGEFLMGSEEGGADDDEKPQHVLYLPTFYLGKFPVTVSQFRAFQAVSGWRVEGDHSVYFEGVNQQPDHPVVLCSWHDALAYARWRGMGLPSEAEWEKGARGADGRMYPWGNVWVSGRANCGEREERRPRWWQRLRGLGAVHGTTPVGKFSPDGDSPYGCADMAGNVWEWTRSGFADYPYVANDGWEHLGVPSRRVLRGGAFYFAPGLVRCAVRDWSVPVFRGVSIGFRVVVSPFRSEL